MVPGDYILSMMVSSIAVCGNGDIYVGTGSAFDNYGGTGASGFNVAEFTGLTVVRHGKWLMELIQVSSIVTTVLTQQLMLLSLTLLMTI